VMPHRETHPVASGLLSMLETRVEATSTMGVEAFSLSCIWRMLASSSEGTFAWLERAPR
jgi:hypothetical protein